MPDSRHRPQPEDVSIGQNIPAQANGPVSPQSDESLITPTAGDGGPPPVAARRLDGLRTAILAWRRRMHATPVGRVTVKVAVTILGAVVVGVGIVLVPLPGPGWLIVFGGLAIWAIEFRWARVLLRVVRRAVGWWTTRMRSGPWPLRILLWLVVTTAVLSAGSISLRYAFDVDVRDLIGLGAR